MRIEVESDVDAGGEATPRRLRLGARAIDVVEVLDRWFGTGYAYVKLTAADGATYILRHDLPADSWELIMFGSGAPRPEER
jgi:hypothetical protein